MLRGRREVLAYGNRLAAGLAQVGKHPFDLFGRFRQSDHQAAFCKSAQACMPQDFKRPLVISFGTNPAVESRHRFDVVVEDIGGGGQDSICRGGTA